MTFTRILCLLLAGLLTAGAAENGRPTPKFYAYCIGMGAPATKPPPLPDQAKLLRELGFDGIGCECWLGAGQDANLKTLDEAGASLFMCWTSLNINPTAKAAFNPQLLEAIRKLKGRPTTVSVLLTGLKAADPQGLEPAVKALRALGDAAAEAGVRISIYQHVGNWTESLPFVIEVVKKVDHPQVGFNFNLCHWLKVDGKKDYRPLLRENAAKLFCVTINGAKMDAPTWTNGLIQPLDQGDFDLAQLIATLREVGYKGPVGLMCFGVPGEPREHLTRSMAVWRKLNP